VVCSSGRVQKEAVGAHARACARARSRLAAAAAAAAAPARGDATPRAARARPLCATERPRSPRLLPTTLTVSWPLPLPCGSGAAGAIRRLAGAPACPRPPPSPRPRTPSTICSCTLSGASGASMVRAAGRGRGGFNQSRGDSRGSRRSKRRAPCRYETRRGVAQMHPKPTGSPGWGAGAASAAAGAVLCARSPAGARAPRRDNGRARCQWPLRPSLFRGLPARVDGTGSRAGAGAPWGGRARGRRPDGGSRGRHQGRAAATAWRAAPGLGAGWGLQWHRGEAVAARRGRRRNATAARGASQHRRRRARGGRRAGARARPGAGRGLGCCRDAAAANRPAGQAAEGGGAPPATSRT
jgi:hypothetical protein